MMCSREPTNVSVRYTAAVIKEGTTIDHLPINNIFNAEKFPRPNNIRVTNFWKTSPGQKYFHYKNG